MGPPPVGATNTGSLALTGATVGGLLALGLALLLAGTALRTRRSPRALRVKS